MKYLLILPFILFLSCQRKPEICYYRIQSLPITIQTVHDDWMNDTKTTIITLPHREIYVDTLSCYYQINDTLPNNKVIIQKFEN